MTNVLIVDDNKPDLYMLTVLLEGHGYTAITASNGEEALEAARKNPTGLIISDIMMPVMDGFHLCRVWMGDEHLQYIPFVFYSATYTERKDEEFALSLGAARFIIKPTEPDEFMKIIQGVIRDLDDGKIEPRTPTPRTGEEVLKLYDERLVNKLEQKTLALKKEIEDRKQMEDVLRRSQKMDAVGQMASGIAHDFNNFIGIIIGNLNFLKRELSGDEKALKRIKTANKAAQRATDLTRKLLSFSDKHAKAILPANINQVIQGMSNLISHSITPKVEVEHHLAGDLWLTEIDSGDFEDVLLNMILNARDAMPEGGRLTIETSNKVLDADYVVKNPTVVPGEYVELVVADTGNGIPKDDLEHVFEPFFTSKSPGKGTGLGLSIVFNFIQRSKGHIIINSEPGTGTKIQCYLPRSTNKTEGKNLSVAEKTMLSRGTETILLVDDEEDLLEIAQLYLQEYGYTTVTATRGKKALDLLTERTSIDLLFSDVVMPGGMNGYELAERATTLYPSLKVLLTSGYTSKTLFRNGQARFKENLLNKPYNQYEFVKRVRLVLDE